MKNMSSCYCCSVFSTCTQYAGQHYYPGGDVTEIVFALGAGDRVIARDTTSEHPPQVTQLPDVGYLRLLEYRKVCSRFSLH